MFDVYNPPNLTSVLNAGMTQASPARSLNSVFIPNTTQWTYVLYSVRIVGSATITLGGTSNVAGRIELLLASGTPVSPTNMICQARSSTTFSGAVVIGINMTISTPQEAVLVGWVPPGYSVNIFTVNEVGVPTYSLIKVTEWTLG